MPYAGLSQIFSISNKISACNSSQQMKYGRLEDRVVFSPVHVNFSCYQSDCIIYSNPCKWIVHVKVLSGKLIGEYIFLE